MSWGMNNIYLWFIIIYIDLSNRLNTAIVIILYQIQFDYFSFYKNLKACELKETASSFFSFFSRILGFKWMESCTAYNSCMCKRYLKCNCVCETIRTHNIALKHVIQIDWSHFFQKCDRFWRLCWQLYIFGTIIWIVFKLPLYHFLLHFRHSCLL